MTPIGIQLKLGGDREVEQGLLRVRGAIDGMGSAAATLARSMGGIGGALAGAFSVHGFVQAADAVTTLNNQLKLATGSSQQAAQAYGALFDIAQRSRVSFVELGGTFASIARATGEMGISQQRLLGVTEAIGNAVTVSGSSAQAANAALMQLGQGLASGTLRGEELNSVMEQTPRLAKALADGMGVSIGELRKLGSEGAITSEQVIKALESQAGKLQGEVKDAVLTVGQAFTQLKNSATVAAGDLDKASGASQALAGAMSGLSGAIDTVGAAIRNHEGAFATLAGGVGGAAAVAGVAGLGAALVKVGTAAAGLGAVLAANPAVLALLGIGVAVGAGITGLRASSKTADGIQRAIDSLRQENERSEAAYTRAVAGGRDAGAANILRVIEQRKGDILKLQAELYGLSAGPVGGGRGTVNPDTVGAMNAREAKTDAALAAARRNLYGVKDDYEPKLKGLAALYDNGNGPMQLDEYRAAVAKLANENYKAGKSADSAARSQSAMQTAYQSLMGTIGEKIGIAQQELAQTGKLSESQRLSAKIEADLLSGKLKLTDAGKADVKASLDKLAALEQQQRLQATERANAAERLQIQDELNAAYVQESKAREAGRLAVSGYVTGVAEASDALRHELSLMGLSQRERAIAIEQYRIELDLKKQIEAVNANVGFNQSQRNEEIARLQSAAAIAKANASSKVFLDDWKQSVGQYDDIFRKGFADMLNNGKDGWKSFARSLVTTFKTSVADQIYKMFAQPFLMRIVASVAGVVGGGVASAAQAASGGSNLLGMASNASSLYSGASSFNAGWFTNFGATLPGSIASTGAQLYSQGFETLGNGLMDFGNSIAGYADALNVAGDVLGYGSAIFAAANGKWGQAIGSAVGTYFGGPIGSFIGSTIGKWADKIFSGGAGTPHTGGAGSYSAAGGQATGLAVLDQGLTFGVGERYYNGEAEKAAVGISQGIVQLLDSTATAFGQKAGYYAATAFADDSSKDGAWGSLIIRRDGEKVLDWADTQTSKWAPKVFADGEAGQKEYVAAIAASARDALKTALGDATWAKDMLDQLGSNVTMEGLDAAVQQIAKIESAFTLLGNNIGYLADISGATQTALLDLSGGIGALMANAGAYYENFYSADEQRAAVQRQLQKAFDGLNLKLPDIDAADARAQFRALAEAQDLTTDAGRKTYASLLQLSGAFAGITQSADEAAQAAQQLADQQQRQADDAVNQALAQLRQVVKRERDALSAQADTLESVIGQIGGAVGLLTSNARELYGSVDSTQQMLAAQGMVYIEDALAGVRAGASVVDYGGLADAIGAARSGVNAGVYASEFERQRDTLVLAGQLAELGQISDAQLSVEERALKAVQEQIAQLDKTLDYWEQQASGMGDLLNASLSIEGAIGSLAAALAQREAAKQSAGGGGGRPGVDLNQGLQQQIAEAWNAGDWITAQNIIRGYGFSNDQLKEAFDLNYADLRYLYSHGYTGQNPGDYSFSAKTAEGVYAEAKAQGLTLAEVDKLINAPAGTAEEWAKANGLPIFHQGTNYVPRTGFALLEQGEQVIPRANNPFAGGQMPHGNNAELIAEVRALRAEVAALRAPMEQTAQATAQQAEQFDNVTAGGNAMATEVMA